MKRLHLIIICILCTLATTVRAQYYSVNFDKKTVAAMATAYATGAAAEAYYNEQVQDILKHYNAAEVATAGIYAAKFLEHRSLSDLGIWSSSTENYYYRRIRKMVTEKIMPKIWTVAGMMLKSPQNALYWGSYLMKVCDDTKALCMQFESVVTNGVLSFKDVPFLEIAPNIKQILDLSKLGNVDWQQMLNDLAKVPGNFSKDNLEADINTLYQMGVGLAQSGATNIGDRLLQSSNFNDLFSGKISKIMDIYNNYNDLFEQWDGVSGKALIQMTGGKVDKLFDFGNYNITAWMDDYLDNAAGNYYTQRWYIYRRDAGSETLCHYVPPTDDNSILNGSHWYRIETGDANFSPNSSQRESILNNSENHAGWSRNRVNQLNNSNDGFTYSMSYWMSSYIISKGNRQTKKAYAYEITVTKSWDRKEEIYEDVFDSYSMDLNVFKNQLNARLSEFNDNEEGYIYYIGSDARKYYQATDAAKLKGVETVTISVTCSDGVKLGEGTTSYKCRKCGGSLNQHSKDCVMSTSVTENELDLSELDSQLTEAQNKVSSLQSEITTLQNDIKRYTNLINQYGPNTAIANGWYDKKAGSEKRLKEAQNELGEWQKKLDELKQAKEEAGKDNEVPTDDYYRIPAIMNDMRTAYNITWSAPGTWSGYTFIRKGTMPNINGVLTFKATLSIARKPKYFLGIKIHRAILQINWELTSEYSNTQVVEVMYLDPNKSDKEKSDEVNKKISEIARAYPDCQITTEYAKSAPTEEQITDDVKHLLWSSDRLAIAREIDSRITAIYADLVSLEKMMHYKHSIIDVLKDFGPQINFDQDRRHTVIDSAYVRWRDNGRAIKVK